MCKHFVISVIILHIIINNESFINWHCASATTHQSLSLATAKNDIESKRDKRYVLPFPLSSTIGLIAAVAMPVDIPNREVFFSYNFEANYNMPDASYVENPFKTFGFIGRGADTAADNTIEQIGNSTIKHSHNNSHNNKKNNKKHHKNNKKKTEKSTKNNNNNEKKTVTRRSLLSRKIAYNIFERKLNALGFNGRSCLLKAICQSSETPLGHYNGVLGDILHIILTPTSSRDDDIIMDYYEAEYNGLLGDCRRYDSNCPKSVIEFISIIK